MRDRAQTQFCEVSNTDEYELVLFWSYLTLLTRTTPKIRVFHPRGRSTTGLTEYKLIKNMLEPALLKCDTELLNSV